MSFEQFFEQSGNVIVSPDAISKLRKFILDMAVRGMLIEQDPKDEPVSKLLHCIDVEKTRMLESGEIKKTNITTDRTDRHPFEIPTSWQWVRLDSVGAIVGGGTPSTTDANNFAIPGDGIPWVTPADLGKRSELFISRGARDISENGLKVSSAKLIPSGSVLFSCRAPIGYVAIAKNSIATNQGFKSVVPYIANFSRFIALVLTCFAPRINENAPGTTYKEISGRNFARTAFPLVPLAEQQRIVSKVNELMAHCDQLEEKFNERESRRKTLTNASFASLNEHNLDPLVFRKRADFVIRNFGILTKHLDQIKLLRQTIIDLAVRGKLVEQDPDEEPASTLLEFCEAEKSGDVVGWIDSAVGALLDFKYGKGKKASECLEFGPVPVYGANGVVGYCETALTEISSIVIGRKGSVGVLNRCDGPSWAKDVAYYVEAPNYFDLRYMFTALQSLNLATLGKGVKPGLSRSDVYKLPLSVPPLAEQRRIVTKVDQLTTLCDQLEVSLDSEKNTSSHLLDSLLSKAPESTFGNIAPSISKSIRP